MFSGRWKLQGLYCYQFFDIKHSYQKASELCQRLDNRDKLIFEGFLKKEKFTKVTENRGFFYCRRSTVRTVHVGKKEYGMHRIRVQGKVNLNADPDPK